MTATRAFCLTTFRGCARNLQKRIRPSLGMCEIKCSSKKYCNDVATSITITWIKRPREESACAMGRQAMRMTTSNSAQTTRRPNSYIKPRAGKLEAVLKNILQSILHMSAQVPSNETHKAKFSDMRSRESCIDQTSSQPLYYTRPHACASAPRKGIRVSEFAV